MGNMMKLINISTKLQVGKNRDGYQCKYRNAEDILAALKPLLHEYGVAITMSDRMELIGTHYYLYTHLTAYDAEDGSVLAETEAAALEAPKPKGEIDGKVTGSASTYARRYALAGMFNVVAADDFEELDRQMCVETAEKLKRKLAECHVDADDFATWGGKGAQSFDQLSAQDLEAIERNFDEFVANFQKFRGARK